MIRAMCSRNESRDLQSHADEDTLGPWTLQLSFTGTFLRRFLDLRSSDAARAVVIAVKSGTGRSTVRQTVYQ